MVYETNYRLKCAYPSCSAKIKADHWNKKKAQKEGWFLQRTGESWCPNHNPPWVEEWRAKQISKERDGREHSLLESKETY